MSSEPTKNAEQLLGEQLKKESLAERPAFSAGLRARVMAEVAAPGDVTVADGKSRSASFRRKALRWAAIAAGLLASALGIYELRQPGGDPPLPSNDPSRDLVVVTQGGTKLNFDDLNHGAGIALRLVVDQLPIDVPADDWGLPSIE